MKRNILKRITNSIVVAALVGTMTLVAPMTAYASSNSLKSELDDAKDKLNDNQKQQNALKQQQENNKNTVNQLNQENEKLTQESSKLSSNIETLTTQLETLVGDITDAENAVDEKTKEIEEKQLEIEQTESALAEQRVSMSRRIQYLYENDNKNIVVMLLESNSFVELLNRLEYANSVTKYDNQMLDNYTNLVTTLNQEKTSLETSQMELIDYQDQLAIKKGDLKSLVASNSAALLDANGKLIKNKDALAATLQNIVITDEQLKAMEEKEAELRDSVFAAQEAYAKKVAEEESVAKKKAEEELKKAKEEITAAQKKQTEATDKYQSALDKMNAAKTAYDKAEAEYQQALSTYTQSGGKESDLTAKSNNMALGVKMTTVNVYTSVAFSGQEANDGENAKESVQGEGGERTDSSETPSPTVTTTVSPTPEATNTPTATDTPSPSASPAVEPTTTIEPTPTPVDQNKLNKLKADVTAKKKVRDEAYKKYQNLKIECDKLQQEAKKAEEDVKAAEKKVSDTTAAVNSITTGTSSGQNYGGTDYDVLMLAAIIQAEADNQGTDGRLAVGSVVMNRVYSPLFPKTNSIESVIYAKNQFAPVASGRFAAILAKGPNSGCIECAKQVISGYRNTDELFFCTYSYAVSSGLVNRTEGTVLKSHYFYHYIK